MKKSPIAFIFAALLVTAAGANAADNRAVEININGIGPGVDEAAFTTVKQVIGNAVANGVIDKFIVNGRGIEGGFFACAESSSRNKGFVSFIKQLRTITPNPSTTAYSINAVEACADTSNTFCTQDAFMCPDGSYVGRVPPSCEFAPCPGN
ncbi:MAG: hypothetical protein Q7U57_11385 [Methylovulum sp.]|nr:hypothetical protein [Methylovulum sp.]